MGIPAKKKKVKISLNRSSIRWSEFGSPEVASNQSRPRQVAGLANLPIWLGHTLLAPSTGLGLHLQLRVGK